MADKLPDWLTRNEAGAYIVDADKAYPIALKALDVPTDQFGVECAYQCIKLKVQEIAAASGEDPRDEGKPLAILVETKDKEKWRLAALPEGRGVTAATQGLEAKRLFEKVRGKLV